MKHLLLTTIAAVVLVGCGESQQSTTAPETKPAEPIAEAAQPKPPTAEAPRISIHKAAEDGNIEAVKQYLVSGADVNAKGRFGETALDVAVFEPHPEIADLLRKHGGKHSTINAAAWSGDTEAVKEFLAAGVNVNEKDEYGNTPLHRAAYYGHKEIVELLIAKGADVNAKTKGGRTPLREAAAYGHKEIAELLIANGADVNAKDVGGETPLDAASGLFAGQQIHHGHTEIADLLRKHGGKTGEELKAEGK